MSVSHRGRPGGEHPSVDDRRDGDRVTPSRRCFSLTAVVAVIFVPIAAGACSAGGGDRSGTSAEPVAFTRSEARAADGRFIAWRERIVDSESVSGMPIRGSDGLETADLDGDGYLDVVSVHEADTDYGGTAEGWVRVAFGSTDPEGWVRMTLAEGAGAGAAEDVAIGDVNGDGFPDVVVACELAHLLYLQNPGPGRAGKGDGDGAGEDDADGGVRSGRWKRVIPPVTRGRGSFIRVFLADLDGDGRPEVVAANKGAQSPDLETAEPTPISWFEVPDDPLDGKGWIEHELARVPVPINSRPVDLDGDGDLDVFGGSRGEGRVFWLENLGAGPGRKPPTFREHRIGVDAGIGGFNVDFVDLSGDGRLDILVADLTSRLVWLEQPDDPGSYGAAWRLHEIGSVAPDLLVGVVAADIDGDGDADVMTGGYSLGPRDRDGEVTAGDSVGRIVWFENTGDLDVGVGGWVRHDVSRRVRGMYDRFVPRDLDDDGDVDFLFTRGNSGGYDGVYWLEQLRTSKPINRFQPARASDSRQLPLPVP